MPSSRPILPNAADGFGLLDFRRMRRVYEFSNHQHEVPAMGWRQSTTDAQQQLYFPSVWVDVL